MKDEEINFMLVNSILSRSTAYDFSIIRAMNGKETVEICKKMNHINLVLMPIMDMKQHVLLKECVQALLL